MFDPSLCVGPTHKSILSPNYTLNHLSILSDDLTENTHSNAHLNNSISEYLMQHTFTDSLRKISFVLLDVDIFTMVLTNGKYSGKLS